MKLRHLFWMAQERKRVLGELAAVQMAWLALKFTGESIDPARLNPYPGESAPRPRKKTTAERKTESDLAWQVLDKFFHKGKGK